MNSGRESARSIADYHADGTPTLLLERRDGRGRITNRYCSEVFVFGAYSTELIPGKVGAGTNDSIHRRTFCIQRCGRSIIDGKGNHVSRLRRYRTLVPDDGDVAIRFTHALRGGSFGIPFDQDGDCRLKIFPVALVGNVPLEVEESRYPFGLYRLGNIVRKLARGDGVLSLRVFEDKR
jgi:hypothetical protein